jgi:hypothetical protein
MLGTGSHADQTTSVSSSPAFSSNSLRANKPPYSRIAQNEILWQKYNECVDHYRNSCVITRRCAYLPNYENGPHLAEDCKVRCGDDGGVECADLRPNDN